MFQPFRLLLWDTSPNALWRIKRDQYSQWSQIYQMQSVKSLGKPVSHGSWTGLVDDMVHNFCRPTGVDSCPGRMTRVKMYSPHSADGCPYYRESCMLSFTVVLFAIWGMHYFLKSHILTLTLSTHFLKTWTPYTIIQSSFKITCSTNALDFKVYKQFLQTASEVVASTRSSLNTRWHHTHISHDNVNASHILHTQKNHFFLQTRPWRYISMSDSSKTNVTP